MPTARSRRALLRRLAAAPLAGALAFLAAGAGRRGVVDPAEASPGRQAGDIWAALASGGHVAMIRHAEAPGVGDPPAFRLDDCSTQRNLSDGGRAQADRIGAAFRDTGVAVDLVLTSGWCRCIETATRAFGGAAVWPALHSFFQDGSTETEQTAETRAGVAAWAGPGSLVLVTHQVNITALTGIFPASGEVIVLKPLPERPEGFVVVGRAVVR